MSTESRDLLITATEVNHRHGVGILLLRLFPESIGFISLRSTTLYDGEQAFGDRILELRSQTLTIAETEGQLAQLLAGHTIRRILCVPYYREDFVHAILAKKITGAPLCTYLMDDQNIFERNVSDHWVKELLGISDLRLGISPEMCAAYRRKYQYPMELLPPVMTKNAGRVPCYWNAAYDGEPRTAMIGNVWNAQNFNQLRAMFRDSGLHLDWYGAGSQASWLPGNPDEWESDNIHCLGYYPEDDLVAALGSYPFIVVPSGNLDHTDANPAFSRLSLPSRILFLHAKVDTPVLILGSRDSAAGRFVTSLDTGLCTSYDPESFAAGWRQLLAPDRHARLKANIRHSAEMLVQEDAGEWIWRSLTAGRAAAARFQEAFPPGSADHAKWLDDITPPVERPARSLLQPGDRFSDRFAPTLAFLRQSHLPILAQLDPTLPGPAELELTRFQDATLRYALEGALSAGGDVLFLGAHVPANLLRLPTNIRLWRIADLVQWQDAGFPGDSGHIVSAAKGEAFPKKFPQFAAIVSVNWCGQLGAEFHAQEGLSLYLEACTQPTGLNLHFFNAVLNKTLFWISPNHAYLRKRFILRNDWPDMDELLSSDDVFTMSETAYNQHWFASTQKPYASFGRPLSLGLFWRKSAAAEMAN